MRLRLAALVGAALGALASCGGGTPAPAPVPATECLPDPACTQLMVVAHRGYHATLPENSLAAIGAAAAVGADFAEVDVRHTKDEVLVLMHDAEVDRTTDGTGLVSDFTWEEIQALTLDGGEPADPESVRVPRFLDVLAVATETGLMLYVDEKTERADLVLAAIQGGAYHGVVLLRDVLEVLAPLVAQDDRLMVMPPLTTSLEFDAARAQVPGLLIVELAQASPDATLAGLVRAAGVKVQQDVMTLGDIPAVNGDYRGWISYVDAGVTLLQTDYPQLLVPAVDEHHRTGVFPEQGPGIFQ